MASSSNDLETHIQDLLGVLTFEDLREVVPIGHSYGGMVATGVADRARDRVAQLIYLDAFVPTLLARNGHGDDSTSNRCDCLAAQTCKLLAAQTGSGRAAVLVCNHKK